MDANAIVEPRAQVDHEFLDAVDVEISRALQRAADLEAGLTGILPQTDNSWHDALDRMSENLVNWQARLGELGRQTAAIESDLNEQEHAIRGWLQSLAVTSGQLASASKH